MLVIFASFSPTQAQHYVIQKGDRLAINFWQEPDLSTEVIVGQDGSVDLPVVGRMQTEGLTSLQLGEKIVEEISRYRINITQVSVIVREYEGNKVFVTGHVGAPGPLSFEVMPNLWRILQEAGGLQESADLERISIVRGADSDGEIISVDLSRYFENGALDQLPPVYGGDTVHVPGNVTRGAASTSPFSGTSEVYVFGAVAAPGRYSLEKTLDVLDAIVLAGGPTNDAKLSEVRILNEHEQVNSILKINLDHLLDKSYPGAPQLHPGDTIFVPRKTSPLAFLATRVLLPVVTSASVFLIVQAIR